MTARISKQDSADLGFAMAALLTRAISLAEFRDWADHVITRTPAGQIPDWFFDLSMLDDDDRRGIAVLDIVPFTSYDPDLDANGPSDALAGIAHLRGRPAPTDHDPVTTPAQAAAALDRHPEVRTRFRALFPFIELPEPA